MTRRSSKFRSWKSWSAMLILALLVIGLLLGLWFWLSGMQTKDAPVVRLENTTDYQVKSSRKLIGVDVLRIASRQQPQEFVVASPVPVSLLDAAYGKPVDRAWANQLANRFAVMVGDSLPEDRRVSVELREIRAEAPETIRWKGRDLPYWELFVEFRLNSDTASRYYQLGVIRDISGDATAHGNSPSEVVLIAYAPDGVYERKRMLTLLDSLGFSYRSFP